MQLKRHSLHNLILMGWFLLWLFPAQAQTSLTVPDSVDAVITTLISSSAEESVIHYSFSAFSLKGHDVDGKFRSRPYLGNTAPLLEQGSPDLLLSARSLIIPDDGRMEVEVLHAVYEEYHNVDLLPSKGNLLRNTNPDDVPYVWGPAYQQDRFFPGQVASLREPYVLRDYRGQTVLFYPFQYNPVTKVLRVYYDVTVRVYKAEAGGENRLERATRLATLPGEFYRTYARHFLNFAPDGINYTPLGEEGKMLVISHGPFMPAMEDFVRWKNMKGIPTEMVNVSTIGTTAAAIKSYVTNYYNTHGLTFLLLVGDAAQIPTHSLAAGHSDNTYGYLVGNDSYPELFVGRFSSETASDVEIQVMRTLMYEIAPDTTGGWLEKSIGIASSEGPGHYGEMDYQHVRLMQTDLLGYTYTHNLEYFEGSQGGNDAPGNPTQVMVTTAVNNGAGTILYTGHGSTTSWATSGFANTNVNSLTNLNRWPFIWSVACVNGNFVNSTCFAETWLRASSGDQPTGAVAMFASTVNQAWNPPMEGQDEMVDILVESYANNTKRTFGGLSINGCMKMNDVFGNAGSKETDHWTIFGDPSVFVRTMTPTPIMATHAPAAQQGGTIFPVFSPDNGARATLSHNGVILGSAVVTGSVASIQYSSPLAPDTMDLVITAFNKIPYIARVTVLVPNAPYVIYQTHDVNDIQGNSNQRADYGETISLDLTLENIGMQPSGILKVILRSKDAHVTVIDSITNVPAVPQSGTQLLSGSFTIHISDSVPNAHSAMMELHITDALSNQWTSWFSILCHAPSLVIDTLFINDLVGGNGNGKLEPGEVVIVNAQVRNKGGAEGSNHLVSILANHGDVHLFGNQQVNISQLPLNTPVNIHFYARLDTTAPMGTSFRFDVGFVSGHYSTTAHLEDMVLGGDEDFETGDFQKFSWQHAGSNPWTITTQSPYEGSYCARSGAIGHNAQTSLSIDWYAAYPDTLSFWLKVSCENGSVYSQKWDNLEFFINGVSKEWWDGTKPWFRVAYLIPAGQHTFTWRYQKDAYAVAGSDAAWLDMITFPAAGAPVALKPFLLMEEVLFSDHNGNNNGIINAGEKIDIAYQVRNLGYVAAQGVNSQLATAEPQVNLINPSAFIGSQQPAATLATGFVMQVELSPAVMPGQVLAYQFTMTDDQSLSWSYPFTMEVEAVIGLDVPQKEESILLYPNPFADILSLRMPDGFAEGDVRVQIFTVDGRVVLDRHLPKVIPSETRTLDTSAIPTGAMVVRVITGERVYTGKLIRR
jgi:hypothetical protein